MGWTGRRTNESAAAADMARARAMYKKAANQTQNAVTCWFVAALPLVAGIAMQFIEFSDVESFQSSQWGVWIIIGAVALITAGFANWFAGRPNLIRANEIAKARGFTLDDL